MVDLWVIRKTIYWIMTMVLMFCMTSVVEIKAQEEEVYKAKIVEIKDVKQIEVNGKLQTYQKLVLVGLDGKSNERKIEIENGNLPVVNPIVYEINDKVMIKESSNDGEIIYVIEDTIRTDSLFLLFSIFVTMVVLVSKGRGLLSILSMGVSFGVIFLFILPRIANGDNPVVVATLGALIIIPVIFFLSHGFNSKTTIAILGTVVALAITGVLAQIFIGLAYLYGFSSEESGFLFAENQAIDMSGILLAGIVIGAMGVLDDVAVSQASIVEQLKLSSEKIKRGELFARAMKVGQDHIASMINTLILVYAGASLPLLLIFIDNPRPYSEIVNYEFIAEEIVRTLVGSIGLITAVPVTTLLAAMWFGRKK